MSAENEVLAAARGRAHAMSGNDDDALRGLLHVDFVWTSHTGARFDRASYMRSNSSRTNRWKAQTLIDPAVITAGDTAVLTCTVRDEVDNGSGVETFTMPMTQTWTRVDGRWLLLAGHAGPCLSVAGGPVPTP